MLAHRIFWTFLAVSVVHLARRSWREVREAARSPRILGLEALAGVLLGSNWLVWLWAVNNERVLEGSLGYFITPLVSILLGVLVLGERLRRGQWLAVSLGVASVVWLTIDMGRLPWVSLCLAATFGTYGLIKKKVDMPPLDMLAVELSVMLPVTLAFLAFRTAGGHEVLMSGTPGGQWGLHRDTPALLRRGRPARAVGGRRRPAVPVTVDQLPAGRPGVR